MKIIPFTLADQEETSNFMKEIFDEMGWTPLAEDGLDDLSCFFHLPDAGYLFIAKKDGKVIGTAGVAKIDENTGLIKRVYVDKNLRKLGMGKSLLNALINLTDKYNISRLVLDVSKNNAPAIHLYEKYGFNRYDQSPVKDWPESNLPDTHYFYYLNIK